MNIPLLRKVQTAITMEPSMFDMDNFFGSSEESPCGTTCCIGGWAVTLAHTVHINPVEGRRYRETLSCSCGEQARLDLDLTQSQADELFYLNWGDEFIERYDKAKTPQDRAEVAYHYIDYFIEKYAPQ